MKEKQSKGVLRRVPATSGDIEISEKQQLTSPPDTKKKSKVIASQNKDVSINIPKGASSDESCEDKTSCGLPETNLSKESESNPRRSIKNLAGFWSASSAQSEDGKSFRKKRFHVDEGLSSAALQGDEQPDRIIRADDVRSEQKPQIEVSEGHAKCIASMFLNRSQDSVTPGRLVRLDKEFSSLDEELVAPNDSDGFNKSVNPFSSVKLRRRIKDIAGTFSSASTDEDTQNEKRTAMEVGNSDEPVVLEKGRTRGLADRWQQQRLEQEQEALSARAITDEVRAKPAWLIELEMAKELEPVVYENEPVVRDDVIRADDETTDVISVRVLREARQKWSTIEKDEIKKKEEKEAKAALQTPQSKKISIDEDNDIVTETDIVNTNAKQENKTNKNVVNEKDKLDDKVHLSIERDDGLKKNNDNKTKNNSKCAENIDVAELKNNEKLSEKYRESLQMNTISQSDDDDDGGDDYDDEDDDGEEEDIDKYFTEGESGLVLSGAVLIHIPRSKLLHSLCD